MAYCTLFNSNYLDKGIVMISSLFKYSPTEHVYVLCMDETCKVILDEYFDGGIITISLNEFEDDDLLRVKPTRSAGEYCWTCTAKLIKYVLIHFEEHICTYIDSDLYFYSDPKCLIDEMISHNCTVQLVSHNFNSTSKGRRLEKESGKNCVQFNTFTNEERSMDLLDLWIRQCINECSVKTAGDQGYTSDWGEKDFVNISSNSGAGVAPWNVDRFKMVNKQKIYDRTNKRQYDLVFYHFQGVINRDRYFVKIEPLFYYLFVDKKLVFSLYYDYLKKTEEVKSIMEKKYGILPIVNVYISDSHTNYTMFQRIKESLHLPMSLLLEKVLYRVLEIIRAKEAIVDVRKL